MNDMMTQEQALQILIPMRNMMYDQNGCPISDVVFALDKAIEALSADRPKGEWIRVGHDIYECSLCHQNVMTKDIDCYSYCHRCGAKMGKGGEDE